MLTTSPPPRRGFTIVELLIVVVVISILVGLLIPAIAAVRSRVRIAQVRNEITALESAITQFKGEFGVEPPSKIILCEAAAGWNTQIALQSKNTIREIWPLFDFTKNRDLNRNGTTDETFILTGDECLVFFLGGPASIVFFNPTSQVYGDKDGDGQPEISPGADGFSKNPADPFEPGGARIGPFHEFDPDRMVDVDADHVFSYAHLFPTSPVPYLYLSSYDGRGYRPLDGDIDQDGVLNGQTELGHMDAGGVARSAYHQSTEVAWKDKSYQIISAGEDGMFGTGGPWSSENGVGDKKVMAADRDNVTNFSSGTLD